MKNVSLPGHRLDSIQVLRGCAALLVVLQHSHLVLQKQPDFPGRFCFTGVDLFFVISGYIFTRQAAGKAFDGAAFVRNRFVRIYPSYWLLLPLVLLCWLVGVPDISEMTSFDTHAVLKSILLLPQVPGRLYSVAWTLEIELLFYAIFATLCRVRQRFLLIPVLSMIGLAGLFRPSLFPGPASDFFFWDYPYTAMFLIEFATGSLIFELRHVTKKLGWRLPLLAGLTSYALSVALLLSMKSAAATNAARIFGMSFSFALLMIAALNAEARGRLQSPVARLGVFAGEASYSIYLVHLLGYGLVMYLRQTLGYGVPVGAAREVVRSLSIGLAIGLAVAYYVCVERPLLRWTRQLLAPSPGSGDTSGLISLTEAATPSAVVAD